ncbi:MAG: pyruvate flavodoxin/ferredoxin oxidoreductase [Pseudomonadota bacterium]
MATTPMEYLNGTTAIVRGALDAGCDFFAGYPITPSSGVLVQMMRELPARGGVALQGEDEIASMGFCIAAAMAGRRVLTATSGPGLSLYSESLGLAVMGEVPLVVINVQRLGPATGGATTGAEGDIQFVQWVTSGGIPMVVLSPVDVPTSYWLTTEAFRIAESLRVPVILNTSKDLVLTMESVDPTGFRKAAVAPRRRWEGEGTFKPYAIVAPQDVPAFLPIGDPDHQVRFTTSMHGEEGILSKKLPVVDETFRHLAAKIDARAEELALYDLRDDPAADILIVASGVSARIAMAAVRDARDRGQRLALLVLYTQWPVPEEAIRRAAADKQRIIVPEMNLGLYRREVERVLPGKEVLGVNRVDGAPITPEMILREAGLA